MPPKTAVSFCVTLFICKNQWVSESSLSSIGPGIDTVTPSDTRELEHLLSVCVLWKNFEKCVLGDKRASGLWAHPHLPALAFSTPHHRRYNQHDLHLACSKDRPLTNPAVTVIIAFPF